ncbi:hypothetical protein ACOMHN_055519 [Nucella lapillus]
MKRSSSSLACLFSFLCCTVYVLNEVNTAHACTFPDFLQWREGDVEFNWHSRIRNGRIRESAYSIRHNVIEVSHSTSALKPVRWKCALTYHEKYLVKRQDPDTSRSYSACVKFLQRSSSIVQLMWSRESNTPDPTLCDENNLALDPWPLVSFKFLMDDFTPSPFQGGFNMRITDSESGENGCNYMHRPMKLESDCITGEGVILDFISRSCVPEVGTFLVRQRTLPVAAWEYKGDHYVILRRRDAKDLFCLRMPVAGKDHMNAFLFTDLACMTEQSPYLLNVPTSRGIRYLVLHLQRYVYRKLCDDEYPQCSAVTCSSYIRHECQKSCAVCDVSRPPPTCSYPRRYRGRWIQTDIDGVRQVTINDTDLVMDKVGNFRCVTYPDSPARKTRMYTTVSMFANGCRPRYTCIKLKRLGPSVLRYTLSRSSVWPDLEKDFGQAVCASKQFAADPKPINDLYRTAEDTGKPVVSNVAVPERVPCNLSSSFTITATLPNGSVCLGHLFQLCEDSTRLGIHFHPDCGQILNRGRTISPESAFSSSSFSFSSFSSSSFLPGPSFTDYSCMANYEGHYWERILLLQNADDAHDVSCLVFTQLDVTEALMMVGGQCDKNSWNFGRAGWRKPLMSLKMEPEEFPCKYLPKTTTTTTTTTTPSPVVTSNKNGHGSVYSVQDSHHPDEASSPRLTSNSFNVNVTPSHSLHHSPGSRPRISASYEEHQEREKAFIDYNQELSPTGKEPGSGAVSYYYLARMALGFPGGAIVALGGLLYWFNR